MNIQSTKWLTDWLIGLGIGEFSALYLKLALLVFTLFIVCFIINLIVKKLILHSIELIIKKTKNAWDDALVENKVFTTLSHIVPALVINIATPYIFDDFVGAIPFILRLVNAYISAIIIIVIINFLKTLQYYFESKKLFKDNPLDSYFQLAKITIYIIGGIIILSFLLNKSPLYFFSALGAMTVVLLLVFKDTIMGFVASIQLAVNDMVRIGDWVAMPKYGADGDVVEMNLTTIKIQNWDKTITTIPTYAFISDSFTNWRGMSESGGRRIKRSLNITISSIKFCTPELLERFKKFHLIKEYIEEKSDKIEVYNKENKIDKSNLINGRNMTNIGIFRVYAEAYVKNNPDINPNMTCMVRQLLPTEKGLPIEIYTFSNQQEWVIYEEIMSDMFDHLIAAVPEFELEIFQNPTGTDFKRL
ncbi:MAG: mechanosensitive ion channel protein MscS [Flavobacteriales bacterium]|nr:MAG: mechanosensitive ion channel protein MscS [Flavobacteriales bacterium]